MSSRPESGFLRLRPVVDDDADLLFSWRNEPATVTATLSKSAVSWEDHVAWLRRKIRDQDWRGWMGLAWRWHDDVGLVRFQREAGDYWVVSVVVDPHWRGHNLSEPLIRAGLRALQLDLGKQPLVRADIHQWNQASLKSFERVGFRRDPTTEGKQIAIYWYGRNAPDGASRTDHLGN